MHNSLITLVLLLPFALGCAGGGQVKATRIEVGDRAPAFALADIFGGRRHGTRTVSPGTGRGWL